MGKGLELYTYAGGKKLRCGYTTGSCAAMAARAAAEMLLGGRVVQYVSITTPSGTEVGAEVLCINMQEGACSCGIRKDGGDDIDATHGMIIYAEVTRREQPGIAIDGGEGVGRVTKPGLQQPVGAAAINDTPRAMITAEVDAVCRQYGYTGGMNIIISAPGGEQVAARTFNPNLGIVGGISILGSSGIVQPMSLDALRESIALEIGQRAALGEESLLLAPGNYGAQFLSGLGMRPVLISNFVGDALDTAARHGFRRVLLAGHLGKMAKVAGGIMDTHSRTADCRLEIITAHAALAGVAQHTATQLMRAATTDACLDILEQASLLQPVLGSLSAALAGQLKRRAAGAYNIGAMVYTNTRGLLFQTAGTDEILRWGKANE